ncbi:hypothetical protein HWV62_34851 [Athelia sp. TMB]|nr:hypothetical protein HWV62_34851 [Athelia sp. TMB]
MPFIGPFYVEPKTPTIYARRNPVVRPSGPGISQQKSCLATMARVSLESSSGSVPFFDGQHKMWREQAAQVGRTQLVIYAPSNAEIRIYPALPVRKSILAEQPPFIDDGAAHVASGVADAPPRFPTRSRCPPPPLVIQKQRKSSRRASTSSAIMAEFPSANDVFLTTPRKTVRFA